jgi:hypothetical protein
MAWAPASGRFGWGLLVLKVFLLVVWPLAVMLPVAITQSHSDAAVAACIFFALLPHVVYPWAWLGGKFLHIFELVRSGGKIGGARERRVSVAECLFDRMTL